MGAPTHPEPLEKKALCTLVTLQATSFTHLHVASMLRVRSPDRYSAHSSPVVLPSAGSPLPLRAPRPRHFRRVVVPRGPEGSRVARRLPAPSRFPPHLPLPRRRAWAPGGRRRRQRGSRLGRSAPAAPGAMALPAPSSPLCLSVGARPRLNGVYWLRARQGRGPGPHPGPWKAQGARGRLPGGCGRPGRRAEGAFPGAGAGDSARSASGALRSVWPTGTVLAWSLERAGRLRWVAPGAHRAAAVRSLARPLWSRGRRRDGALGAARGVPAIGRPWATFA